MTAEKDWVLAIDFGTTFTTAASMSEGRIEILEVEGVRRLPSCVVSLDGALVVGTVAERERIQFPDRTERTPKRHLGVRENLLLGGEPVLVREMVGAVLAVVRDEALRCHGGALPADVLLTHPVRWGSKRLDALKDAAALAGFDEVTLLAEPVAAALHYADEHVAVGEYVAVYDFGGGTFDTAVLKRTSDGFSLAGPPGGDDRLGGEDFDRRLMDFAIAGMAAENPDAAEMLRSSPEIEWQVAAAELLSEARAAKESLSRYTRQYLRIPSPVSRQVLITRPEFEALIRTDVQATVDEFVQTVSNAGLRVGDVKARYLTGGSSRIPMVARLVEEAFDQAPDTFDDPKAAVALGAAKSISLSGRPRIERPSSLAPPIAVMAVASAAVPPGTDTGAAVGSAKRDVVSSTSTGLKSVGRSGATTAGIAAAVLLLVIAGALFFGRRSTGSGDTVAAGVSAAVSTSTSASPTTSPTTSTTTPVMADPTTSAVVATSDPTMSETLSIVGAETVAAFVVESYCPSMDLSAYPGGWVWTLFNEFSGETFTQYDPCVTFVCDQSGMSLLTLEVYDLGMVLVDSSLKAIECVA